MQIVFWANNRGWQLARRTRRGAKKSSRGCTPRWVSAIAAVSISSVGKAHLHHGRRAWRACVSCPKRSPVCVHVSIIRLWTTRTRHVFPLLARPPREPSRASDYRADGKTGERSRISGLRVVGLFFCFLCLSNPLLEVQIKRTWPSFYTVLLYAILKSTF